VGALSVRRRLALAGTIQFGSAIHAVRAELATEYPALAVPQSKPLSPGEVLGCTAPVLNDTAANATADAIVFVADGRFHLEAIMIANPVRAATGMWIPRSLDTVGYVNATHSCLIRLLAQLLLRGMLGPAGMRTLLLTERSRRRRASPRTATTPTSVCSRGRSTTTAACAPCGASSVCFLPTSRLLA
jgi:hypothetical protein